LIDYEAIKSKFVRIASAWLGVDVKAVIQSHPNAPQPERPFVVVDILLVQDEDGDEIHRYVDENDNPVYESHKQVSLSYRVLGKDALSIANKLHNMFMLDRIRDEIRTDLGAGVVSVTRVRDLPKLIADKLFDDAAEFEVTINVIDSVTDTLSGIIDTTNFTIEIHRAEGDPDPYITEFDTETII